MYTCDDVISRTPLRLGSSNVRSSCLVLHLQIRSKLESLGRWILGFRREHTRPNRTWIPERDQYLHLGSRSKGANVRLVDALAQHIPRGLNRPSYHSFTDHRTFTHQSQSEPRDKMTSSAHAPIVLIPPPPPGSMYTLLLDPPLPRFIAWVSIRLDRELLDIGNDR